SGVVLLGVFIALNLVNSPSGGVSVDGLFMSTINTVEIAVAAKLMMSLVQRFSKHTETRAIQGALLRCASLTVVTLAAIALCAGTYFS
ncbi:MAG TPA: hypothetical protein VLA39_02975, partial [Marinobacterium sp.]|nr:hypothetical protein [Marinobacterium sp.]